MKRKPCVCNSLAFSKTGHQLQLYFIRRQARVDHGHGGALVRLAGVPSFVPPSARPPHQVPSRPVLLERGLQPATASLFSLSLPSSLLVPPRRVRRLLPRAGAATGGQGRPSWQAGRPAPGGRTGVYIAPSCRSACGHSYSSSNDVCACLLLRSAAG